VLAILQMPYPLAVKQNGEKRRNELAPRLVAFCEDAKKLFRDFGDNTEKEQKPGGEYEDIKPLANKLKEHAARLAVALAYYDRPDVKELTEDNFRRGMCLVSYYATEATRIACSGDYAEPENVVDNTGKPTRSRSGCNRTRGKTETPCRHEISTHSARARFETERPL
jgi:hypothetical protein